MRIAVAECGEMSLRTVEDLANRARSFWIVFNTKSHQSSTRRHIQAVIASQLGIRRNGHFTPNGSHLKGRDRRLWQKSAIGARIRGEVGKRRRGWLKDRTLARWLVIGRQPGAKTEVGAEIGSMSTISHCQKSFLSPALVTPRWDNSWTDSG
jgi:hypothetical protein